jgi:Zn-finger nucleic acid-binding protein/DNA-directed RNA polymerase subunit RPC12/RpoP
MNCPNCGAPMALLENRPAWQCGHCQTMIRLDPGPTDGVRVNGSAPSETECPICRRPLVAATIDDRRRIDACTECYGLLIPLSVFATTVVAKRRAAAKPAVTPPRTSPRDLERVLDCPNCGERMITDWYYGPGNVVIDRCEPCDLVWLDGGELQRVIDAPGPDRLA